MPIGSGPVQSYELLVTKQGKPVVFYNDTTVSELHQKNFNGATWDTIKLGFLGVKSFATALDDDNKLHVIFAYKIGMNLHHCFKGLTDTTCPTDNDLATTTLAGIQALDSFDVATNGKNVVMAAGITVNAQGNTKGVLIRAVPKGVPATDYTYVKITELGSAAPGKPKLVEANLAVGLNHIAASFFFDTGSTIIPSMLRAWSHPLTGAGVSKGTNLLLTGIVPTRMPVAVEGADQIIAAHGNYNADKGRVHQYAWPHSAPPATLLRGPANEAWSNTTAEPNSVDLAMSGGTPIISLIEGLGGGPRAPVILVKGPLVWSEVQLPPLPTGLKAGGQTRVAVSTGEIHLLFDGEDTGNPALFYLSCKGQLPQ